MNLYVSTNSILKLHYFLKMLASVHHIIPIFRPGHLHYFLPIPLANHDIPQYTRGVRRKLEEIQRF